MLSAPSSRSPRARIGTARIDSYSSSGRFGKFLNRGSRFACAAIITGARSSAAEPVIPSPGRMRGRCVISSTRVPWVARSTSSAGPLVVEVDEAGVGVERVGDLGRDLREHLLEVERRVDRLDRVGQEPAGAVRGRSTAESVRFAPVTTLQWLLALHVTGAFLFLGGTVMAGIFGVLAQRAKRPSEVAAFLGLTRLALSRSSSPAR